MPDPFTILMQRARNWFNLGTPYIPYGVQDDIDDAADQMAQATPATGRVVNVGTVCMCDKGLAPSSPLVGVPTVVAQSTPAFNSVTAAPMANIPPFGMCTSLANPTVASATSAAMGVLTPMPCTPLFSIPTWAATSTKVFIGGMPAVLDRSTLTCMYGGQIKVVTTANQIVKAN